MAKAGKIKTPALVVVPQSREAACAQLQALGETKRELVRLDTEMNDELALVKLRYAKQALPLVLKSQAQHSGLQTWCEANREAICAKGTKTADLGTGKVSWRRLPPKVSLKNIEGILAALKTAGLVRFIRTKEEINKEAMQEEPDVAGKLKGVTIGSEGEEFIVEPFEADLIAGVAA